jgi:Carboxypeptidase regulatory-like domain
MIKKTFSRGINLAVLVALSLAFSTVGILAQSTAGTGEITGTVLDSNNQAVANAAVKAVNKDNGAEKTATTNGEGIYKFPLLQPGRYDVTANSSGFAEQKIEVEVFVGRSADANFALGVQGVSAEVQITGDQVQTTASNFDAVQNSAAISNLPINGRRFQDFVTLTPTAQVDPSRGQISLSGQRGINSNINVDGVDYNQPFFGGIRGGERSNSAFTLPQESIREFQVVASGYSAEFGRSSGGIVNAVTKSGTNNLRGSLFYLLRPKQLARANDYAKALADQKLNALGLDAVLAPTQHQFGGSIGGPIIKEKLFYFASYEQQKFSAPRQILFPTLPATGITARQQDAFNFYNPQQVAYTSTNDAYAALGKIDWNVNSSNRFNVRYNFSANKAKNGVSTGETTLDPTTNNSLSTNGTEEDQNHIIVAQLVTTFTGNLINEARFQWAREERPRTPNELIANINTGIGVFGTRNFLPTTQFDRRYQVADSLTYIAGNHTLKFGGEFSDIFADQLFGFNQTGVYTFAGLTGGSTAILDNMSPIRDLTNPVPNARYFGRFDNAAARYNQQVGNLSAGYGIKELAFFVNDSWRVRPNFTLNLGLRFDKQYNPSSENNNTAVLNAIKAASFPMLAGSKTGFDPSQIPDSQNEWGPRVGFAWDPFSDGKTVVRAFAGEYYARTPLIVLAAPFNNFRDPAGDLSVTLQPTNVPGGFNQAAFDLQNPQYTAIVGTGVTPSTVYRQFAILGINLNTFNLSNLPTLTAAQLGAISDRIRNATTNPAANLGIYQNAAFIGITPNYKNPQSFQWGGGFEHEVFKGTTIGLDYSQVNTSYLQRNRDINLPLPSSIDPLTGRAIINRANRPVTAINTLQLRDSSARSLYRALTFRMNMNRKWGRINAFYTLSKSTSDDDNERDSGGVLYDNPYDLTTEYGPSRLDRRHQFVANPVFYLPYGIEVASAIRIRSGVPVNSTVGSDLNGDGNNNERPILVPGIELPRNFYVNRPLYDVDLRIQKGIKFGETRRLVLSAEFFNVLNRSNIQYSAFAVTNYCRSTVEQPGQPAAPNLQRCGLDGITNSTFLQIIDQRQIVNNVANPAYGKINLGNNPGSQVFQMQLGARFQF